MLVRGKNNLLSALEIALDRRTAEIFGPNKPKFYGTKLGPPSSRGLRQKHADSPINAPERGIPLTSFAAPSSAIPITFIGTVIANGNFGQKTPFGIPVNRP